MKTTENLSNDRRSLSRECDTHGGCSESVHIVQMACKVMKRTVTSEWNNFTSLSINYQSTTVAGYKKFYHFTWIFFSFLLVQHFGLRFSLDNWSFWSCRLPYASKLNISYFMVVSAALSGLGSVVGIATAYRLDSLGIEFRWGRDFLHLSRLALRSTQPPVQWVLGLSRG